MGYELTITIKGGSLEIEGDSQTDLEKQLARLDVARLERAILKARGRRRNARKGVRAPRSR